ncbi:MAG: PspC domain-containing protein [Erysipelotrichia bacterium]|jgi:phage shock protein PspC (stress-responsive transcriptional regulator)|nr:PspC domain-containing protein [Erysipelotrichia bacterium]
MAYHDPNTRFYKTSEGAIIGGVCAGLSENLKIDVSLVRIVAIVIGLSGIGVVPYLILWIALPNKGDLS